MKANEAPEKLYLLPNGLISYCRNTDEDVEYIRKDAFIEKTCEWLSKNSPNYINYFISHDFGKFVEDFRKAQKGE